MAHNTMPSIPSERGLPENLVKRLSPMREVLEIITGRRPGMPKIEELATGATTADAVAKINEILHRLQE